MALPGVDILVQQFPIALLDPKVRNRDLAYTVYKFYRCNVAHGDEFDEGFGLNEDVRSNPEGTTFRVAEGTLMLSNRLVWGLLACVVFAEENSEERVPDGYHFTYGGRVRMFINDWWGSGTRFEQSIAPLSVAPTLTLDFQEWMP
ncbi:MAG: hypothetical protein NVV57_00295 [Demequina sp.]|nr:hypothetical protein [Demequina sp.]